MTAPINFEYIYADYSEKRNIPFDYNDCSDYDCVDTCINWERIFFYGVPYGLSNKQLENIDNCNYKDAIKLGSLSGCLILCNQIFREGEDPLVICDDASADLGYIMTALKECDESVNSEIVISEQNVFYIDEIQMEPTYNIAPLKSRIIEELPKLILSLLHVAPDIITYYPSPLEIKITPDPINEERKKLLKNIAYDKMESAMEKITGQKPNKYRKNVLKFADAYQFTDEEYNLVTGHSNSSYPNEVKNKEEFNLFEANGFHEIGDSRVLYKYIEY